MNGGAIFGVFLVTLTVVAVIVFLLYTGIRNNAGVRRAEYNAMRTERNNATTALSAIDEKCDEYREIDSVLVGAIRPIIREYNEKQRTVRQ